jgi:hypothetical protein
VAPAPVLTDAGAPRTYFAPASLSATSAAAALKYLLRPRSCTLLTLNAALSASPSASLTPDSALTGR